MEFTFTVTDKEIKEKWSEKCSVSEWIEMYKNLSKAYSDWSIDMEVAEFIIKNIKEGYIEKYLESDIPEVLKPLLIEALKKNFAKRNEENKNITLEETAGEHEFEAIRVLREYEEIDYSDAINLFCDGYDFALAKVEVKTDLSEISTEKLLEEIKNRI